MNQNTNTIIPIPTEQSRNYANLSDKETPTPRPRAHSFNLFRQLIVEYVCTALFIFFATGGAVEAQRFGAADYAANVVVSLAQGFALIAFISAAASTSGGHLNPAVTLGAFISGCITWWKSILYVLVQLAGGVTASALLLAVLPGVYNDKLGATTPGSGINKGRAFLFEALMTFGLVLVVLSTTVCPIKRTGAVGRLAALPIGLTLSAALLISWPYTGTSLNPARSFGPALIHDTWTANWIYWFGPLTGGLFAGVFHRFIIMPATPKDTTRDESNPRAPQQCSATPGNACS